jgi:hypothetical protein
VPWRATALLATAQLFACFEQSAGGPPPKALSGEGGQVGESQLAVINAEPEVQEAFDNAACTCEAYLIEPAAKSSGDTTPEWAKSASADLCTGDPRLASYVGKYTLTQRQARQCSTAASPSPPTLRTVADGEMAAESLRNGCWNPTATDSSGAPSAGFCRADFNYCLGQQLRLKADSLARPPTNPEARAKILEEARHRFEMAGSEFADTLEKVDASCRPEDGCVLYLGQKSGSLTGYHEIVTTCVEVCNVVVDGGEEDSAKGPARGEGGEDGAKGSVSGEGGEASAKGGEANIKNCPDPPCEIEPTCTEKCTTSPKPSQATLWCNGMANSKRNELLAQTPNTHDHLVSATGALTTATGGFNCTVTFAYPTFQSDAIGAERQRVSNGYGATASLRLADSISQAADLLNEEVRERTASSDAIVLSESFAADLWGPAGQRALAARSLFGDRTPRPGSQPPTPRRLQRDDGPRRALELLEAYRVPVPYQLCASSGSWEALDAAGADAWASAARAELLTKLAAQLDLPPMSNPEGPDLLQSEHAVSFADVRASLDLARDRVDQLATDYSFAPADGTAPGACGRAVLRFYSRMGQQREARAFASSLADGQAPANCLLDGARPSTRALQNAGAAGAIDYLRTRTQALSRRTSIRPWASDDGVVAALGQAQGFVGGTWAEWTRTPQLAQWTLWGDVTSAPSEVIVARSEDELSCLRRGHLPGRALGTPCPSTAVIALAATTLDGVAGRTLVLGDAATYGANDRAFIVGRTCAGVACTYELLDVIYPALAKSRHAFGGKLLDDLGRLQAHDPANPAQAAFNSLGLSNNLIPPLQNHLDSNGQVQAEAHTRFIQLAQAAAAAASAKLEEAQSAEIAFLVNHQAVTLAEDRAEAAQRQVLCDACGACGDNGPTTCAVPRAPTTTLLELGLVPAAGAEPAGYGPHATCTQFLTQARFDLPDDETKEYIGGFVNAALRCTRWATLSLAGQTKLEGLPQRVVTELQSNGDGEFSDQGGEVRAVFRELFDQLRNIRTQTRAFDTTFQVATTRLQAAVLLIDDADPSWFESMSCAIGRSLKVIGGAAAMVGAIAAATAVGGPAGTSIALVELAGLGSGLMSLGAGVETLGSIDDCFDNSGAQAAALTAWAQALESMETLRGLGDESVRLIGTAVLADNKLDKLEADAVLAGKRALLEARLAATNVHGDPAWRALQGKRVLDARKRLRIAQEEAFRARRALEFRTASELRWLRDPGFGADQPADWANRVFVVGQAYLGTNTGTNPAAVDVAGDRITEYGTLLAGFVQRYPDVHDFRLGPDRTILHLRDIIGTQGAIVDSLLFKCKNHPDLLTGGGRTPGDLGAPPCAGALGGVDSVRATFAVASTLSGYRSGNFADGNKNFRLDRIAVNLWAAGFIDCSLSPSPATCVTDQTVRYDLRQDGLVALENLENEHRFYGLRDGVILGARALANETVLSTPADLDDAAIVAFERQELLGRPLAGVYTLTLKSRPELRWQELEDIQVLVHYNYWTPN